MPERKVRKSEQLIKDLFGLKEKMQRGEFELDDFLDELYKKAGKMVMSKFLEEEVTEFLDREYYEHTDEAKGYRNGYRKRQLKLPNGEKIVIEIPRVRGTDENFDSKVLDALGEGSKDLKRVVTEMYARGLSTRDIEDILTDPETGEVYLSKSSVSNITESLWKEYKEFKEQDLGKYDLVYLFLDGVYESIREEHPECEGILCAWGVCSDGSKVLLNMELGNKESEAAWTKMLRDMKRRGLEMPLLVTTDGAPGLINAVEKVFNKSVRQRCLAHKKANILDKVPERDRDEIKARVDEILYASCRDTAYLLKERFEEDYGDDYPSAVECLEDDFEACVSYMKFPKAHHKYIRTTNALERCFLEQKRRTDTIPRFFGEKSALKLAFASLIRAARKWRKIKMDKWIKEKIDNLREELESEEAEGEENQEEEEVLSC